MQTLHVNGYDMAYLDVGDGPPLVCVHGSLCDFRIWGSVIGPLSQKHRVIAVSLRHFFPDHWDGVGETYSIAQHVADMIAFIETLNAGPVDLMGHSGGGHISFRLAGRRPELFIGGANTKGLLPKVLHTLAANIEGSRTEMIPRATHPMFEQAPQRYAEIVLDFLGS